LQTDGTSLAPRNQPLLKEDLTMVRRLLLLAVLLGVLPVQYGCSALAGGVIGGAIGAEAAEEANED